MHITETQDWQQAHDHRIEVYPEPYRDDPHGLHWRYSVDGYEIGREVGSEYTARVAGRVYLAEQQARGKA